MKEGKILIKKKHYIINFNKKRDIVLYILGDTYNNYKPKAAILGKEDFIELINYSLNK